MPQTKNNCVVSTLANIKSQSPTESFAGEKRYTASQKLNINEKGYAVGCSSSLTKTRTVSSLMEFLNANYGVLEPRGSSQNNSTRI